MAIGLVIIKKGAYCGGIFVASCVGDELYIIIVVLWLMHIMKTIVVKVEIKLH